MQHKNDEVQPNFHNSIIHDMFSVSKIAGTETRLFVYFFTRFIFIDMIYL